MEEMGMTEKQFASYLNQLIERLRDAVEIEDAERRTEKVRQIIETLEADRNNNL